MDMQATAGYRGCDTGWMLAPRQEKTCKENDVCEKEVLKIEILQEVSLKLAPPVSRLFGHLIDWVIGTILCSLALGGIASETGEGALFGLILLFGFLVLQIYMMSKSTSLGKKILGLKVYNKNTKHPVGFWMMFIREVVGKFISAMILSLGFLWILFDKDNQGWHDKLIGSVVCYEKKDMS